MITGADSSSDADGPTLLRAEAGSRRSFSHRRAHLSLLLGGLSVLGLSALLSACSSGGPRNTAGSTVGTVTVAGSRIAGASLDRSSAELTSEASVRDVTVSAEFGAVWTALPSVFEALGVETALVDPASFLMGNPNYRGSRVEGRRMSTYLECGSGVGRPNADRYQVTMHLTVQLQPSPQGGTVVRTVLDAVARPRATSGTPVNCTSKGGLERRVMELLDEALGAV